MSTKPDPRSIEKLPSSDALRQLSDLLSLKGSTESSARSLFRAHPELLLPLEFSEFVEELRFPKTDRINPSRNIAPTEVRIPDFTGIHVRPFALPLIMELKGPNDNILDKSTLLLSAGQQGSETLIRQLQTAFIHLLRSGGRALLNDVFGPLPPDLIDEPDLKIFDEYDKASIPSPELLRHVMSVLLRAGVSIVGLIGVSREFEGRRDLIVYARKEYLKQGCILVMYDELLALNELLCDYCSRSVGLLEYFSKRIISLHDGRILKFSDAPFLDEALLNEVHKKLFRIFGDICIYGMGAPPSHSAAWTVPAAFNARMLWARPTYLGGTERLLWAGRVNGKWIVLKERLSDRLKGQVVLYEFQSPNAKDPLV